MNSPVIEIENLSFSYEDSSASAEKADRASRNVLEEVGLTIESGDFACLVGPNGGGKTTLLKLLLGLLEPRKGSIKVFGLSPAQASHRIGYLSQNPQFDRSFPVTVLEVVLMGRLNQGRLPYSYSGKDREAAEAALEEVGLSGKRRASFASLSGGQRQRVLIARMLAGEPELLLLDEPTTYLDLQAEQDLYKLLNALNTRLTMVMVSHDLFFVSSFVNKVVCVKSTVRVHPTEEVSEELVGELYGGELVRMVKHAHEEGEEA